MEKGHKNVLSPMLKHDIPVPGFYTMHKTLFLEFFQAQPKSQLN
jgi:hypothetical protein